MPRQVAFMVPIAMMGRERHQRQRGNVAERARLVDTGVPSQFEVVSLNGARVLLVALLLRLVVSLLQPSDEGFGGFAHLAPKLFLGTLVEPFDQNLLL